MQASYPSDQFPGLPAFTLRTPDGWAGVDAPEAGVLVAVVADGPPSAFRANVVVTARRHEAPVELTTLADGVRQRLLELPSAQLIGEKQVAVGALAGHLARVSYIHPTAGTVVQAVLTVPVHRGHVVDVLDVVGTAGADRIEEDFTQVDQVMHSLQITA